MEGVPVLKEGRNSMYLWKVVSQDSHQLTGPKVFPTTHPYLWPLSTTGCRNFVRRFVRGQWTYMWTYGGLHTMALAGLDGGRSS